MTRPSPEAAGLVAEGHEGDEQHLHRASLEVLVMQAMRKRYPAPTGGTPPEMRETFVFCSLEALHGL